jgi:5'-nucleotidase/UDP-sugar diphosphatase
MNKLCLILVCTVLAVPAYAKKVHITLVQANDVYEMTPVNGGRYGGLARVQTVVERLRRQHPHTYTILAGDLLSPSAIGTAKVDGQRLNGKQMVAVLNAMDWNYLTFGNHEFDIGRDALLQRLGEAKFSVFSSNVLDAVTGKRFANTQGSKLFAVEGVKIGLVGITLPALAKDFVTIEDPFKAAKAAVARLRQTQHADIVILVTHQDLAEDIRFAEQLSGVDLILGGHEHENIYLRRGPDMTPIAKADANARSVYVHQLDYDTEDKSLAIASELKIIDDKIPADPTVKQAADLWVEQAFAAFRAEGFEPHAKVAVVTDALDGREASVRNGQTLLTRLAADSALHAFPTADLALLNAGSIRIDDVIPPGVVTQYDAIRVFPFGGAYDLVSMPGDILKRALDMGLKNRGKGSFLHYANVTNTEQGWRIKGQPLLPEHSYTVAITDFLVSEGDSGLEFLARNPRIKRLPAKPVGTRLAFMNMLRARYSSRAPASKKVVPTVE